MVMGNEAEGLIAERLQSKTYSVKYATRWYPWGIQSPHTSTAMGRGSGEGFWGKLRFELRKES